MESSLTKLIWDFLFFSEHFRMCFVVRDLLTRLKLCVWFDVLFEQYRIWKWRNDRRSERSLGNCVKKPEKKKIKDFKGVWTRDLAIPVRCSTNWGMKPMTLGAGQLWVHMFPWKKWVLMVYEINHIWTAEMKWIWRNDRRSERNLCNCVK